jgi:hypothetical protein
MKRINLISIISIFLISLSCLSASAKFQPTKIFHLSDGSVVKGKLTGIRKRDGAYIIKSSKLGTIAILPDDILNMTGEKAFSSQTQPQPQPFQIKIPLNGITQETIQQTQQTLMADPKINASIQKLMTDPEIMKIFQDPELMKAISSMDPTTIQSNPKIQKLLQNPKIQIILQEAAQKIKNQNQ